MYDANVSSIHDYAEERHNHWVKLGHDWNVDRANRVEKLTKLLEDGFVEKRRAKAQALAKMPGLRAATGSKRARTSEDPS